LAVDHARGALTGLGHQMIQVERLTGQILRETSGFAPRLSFCQTRVFVGWFENNLISLRFDRETGIEGSELSLPAAFPDLGGIDHILDSQAQRQSIQASPRSALEHPGTSISVFLTLLCVGDFGDQVRYNITDEIFMIHASIKTKWPYSVDAAGQYPYDSVKSHCWQRLLHLRFRGGLALIRSSVTSLEELLTQKLHQRQDFGLSKHVPARIRARCTWDGNHVPSDVDVDSFCTSSSDVRLDRSTASSSPVLLIWTMAACSSTYGLKPFPRHSIRRPFSGSAASNACVTEPAAKVSAPPRSAARALSTLRVESNPTWDNHATNRKDGNWMRKAFVAPAKSSLGPEAPVVNESIFKSSHITSLRQLI
ncbi:hypothetical protein KCU88_g51, partial [Aureobasidium melanogenum]